MNLRVAFIAFIAFMAFLGSFSVSGAVVTNCNDAELRAAIAQGGTVTFLCSGTIPILSPTILVTNDVTLDGTSANVTLDAGAGRALFDVSPGARLELRKLSLINGFAVGANSAGYPAPGGLAGGGAIRVSNAVLVATSCLFSNNACHGGTGARAPGSGSFVDASAGGDGNGGAIYTVGSSLFLTNCTFIKNYAWGGDGGLMTVLGNFSPAIGGGSLGGAIGLVGSSSLILDCKFFSNSVRRSSSFSFYYGGALYAKTSEVQLVNNLFTGNSTTNALSGGDGDQKGGALVFDSATTFSSDCTFNGNVAFGDGGAVCSIAGTTTVQRCRFNSNRGGGAGAGGALRTLNSRSAIASCVFSNNFSVYGAGVYLEGVTATVSNSTFMANSAGSAGSEGQGGGIYNAATSTVVNCTLVSNFAGRLGGAIFSRAPLFLQHCTIATNTAGVCGGLCVNGASLSGVILAGNTIDGSSQNVSGTVTDAGYNLSSDATPPLSGTSSNNVNPLLAAPADNGGFAPTMALLPGSPAIDGFKGATFPPTDQRGIARPQRLFSDIGAYELTFNASITRSNQSVWVHYPSVPNHPYTLQSAITPGPAWSDGETKTSATSTVQFSVPNSNSMQFFRVRE